jgi:hypothetical protein
MLALLVALASLGAPAQAPLAELPVSLERIRDELKKPPAIDPNRPLEQPVATFRITIEHPRYVPTIEEWIRDEFKLTALQRQSAEWGAKCCGFNLLTAFDGLKKAYRRSKEERIRREIAAIVAELEARKKKDGKK